MRGESIVNRQHNNPTSLSNQQAQSGATENFMAISGGGFSMKSRLMKILGAGMLVALALVWNSCGTQPGCPTCGTTTNGAYAVIDTVPVPEHNPTGEPGGPFNSFDISWFDPNLRRVYTSDRIGLAVVVTDTVLDQAVNVIEGLNGVTAAGNQASSCVNTIPSIVTGMGAVRLANAGLNSPIPFTPPAMPPAGFYNELTRFGCRSGNASSGAPAPFFNSFGNYFFPGFGAGGGFGGFPGAQCCAARANGVNPLSGPNGLLVTPDGKTLFAGSGSSTVVAFDLTTNPPTVIADLPTGAAPDFDGPAGVGPCIASWNGGAGSDPTCADDRSDEMAYGVVSGHSIVAVINGDPGLPLVTLIDVTDVVNHTNTVTPAGGGHCLPVNPLMNYNPGVLDIATTNATGVYTFLAGASAVPNYPTCILGQIYYDGTGAESANIQVDNGVLAPAGPGSPAGTSTPCPDPSENVASGVSGTGVGIAGNAVGGTGAGSVNVPCHHAPIVDVNAGTFITNNGTAAAGQSGEIAPAGLGALAFNPFHNTFYLENSNCTVSTLPTQSSVAVGCIDEIDPRIGNVNGPIVIATIPVFNCMPAGLVQGPGHDFLVGCGDHDGIAFPPNLIIFDGTTNQVVAAITQIGGTDEVWYNPGDNRYYTASRDYPAGPQLGVVDAGTRQWLVNFPTNSNSHSVTADSVNNHVFVPSQAGNICQNQSSNGCILVIARQ